MSHGSLVSDSKTFWKIVKPAFSDKSRSRDSITIIDNNHIITDNNQIAKTFNDFVSKAVKDLDIDFNPDFLYSVDNIDDTIIKASLKFKKHPSIVKIKEMQASSVPFAFKFISLEDMNNEIKTLKTAKATPIDTLPVNILKENTDLPYILYNYFNNCIASCLFPSKLKLADVSPIYKKGGRNDKTNYRPVSILPVISKVYERLIFNQINAFLDSKLSPYQRGFRKGYNSQYCLILMLEKWKNCIDKGGSSGALLTDLSKAFDCLSHDLLIAKLKAFGFSYEALKLIYSYLSTRSQRVRVNSHYSSWSEIESGVPRF